MADGTDPPKPVHKQPRPLTEEEVGQLLEAVKDDRLYALWAMAIVTGMRRGELLALRWEDVDLDKGVVTVNRSLQYLESQHLVFQDLKTQKSRRQIPIPQSVVAVLRQHKVRQLEERLKLGHWEAGSLVFTNTMGRPIIPTELSKYFKRLVRKANLPDIRFHDLRHTTATLLLRKGVHPKVVQERLGHATINITLDIYSHVMPDLQREATEKLEALEHVR